MQHNQKMTIRVIVDDLIARRWLRGAGGWHLTLKYLEVCCQININGEVLGGMVGFEFKFRYKLCVLVQQRTLAPLEFLSYVVRYL